MNKYWFMVVGASVFEVMWAIGLKHSNTVLEWVGTVMAIAVSFYGLIAPGKHLPVGTVYAVFVGLGTAGTVVADILWFGEPLKWGKMGLICILLVGVVGLKLVSDKEEPEEAAKGADA